MLDTTSLATLTTPSLLEKAVSHCIDQGQLRRPSTLMRINFATTQNTEFWQVFAKEVSRQAL